MLDPIKPALILPEITDTSKWYQKRHHYNDPENQYVFNYVGSATYGSVNYNTKLVDVKDFKSYWDLLNPKWKGKIVSRGHSRCPGPAPATRGCFTTIPRLGPSFIRKLYGEMDVTLFRDYRQGPDWLAVGKFAICFFCDVDVLKQQGLPVDTFGPNVFKEGGGLVQQFGTVNPGESGAASQRGEGVHQLALVAQRSDRTCKRLWPSRKVPPIRCASTFQKTKCRMLNRRFDGVKYLDTSKPEWQEMKPILDVMNEALKAAGKS